MPSKYMNTISGKLPIMGLLLLGGVATAQTLTHVTVNDPRPLAAIALEIERLSGLPVNYEDVPYENAADLEDVTAKIMNAAQQAQAVPGVRVIVPKGGQLVAPIPLGPNGTLPDVVSTLSALLSAVSGYHASPAFPSRFTVSETNGVLYIQPDQVLGRNGQMRKVVPVLYTPITIESKRRTALDALAVLTDQLSKTSGAKVEIGTVPIQAFAISQVTIGATAQPAVQVLTKLLASMNVGTMSYSMLFDPRQKFYALNIHALPNSTSPVTSNRSLPTVPQSSAEGVYFKKR